MMLKTPADSPKGYIGEVDLELPQRLHVKIKVLPPWPEPLTPKMGLRQRSNHRWDPRAESFETTHIAHPKLVPHLHKHAQIRDPL